MPKNTVHGGGSYADHPEMVPLNPDGERAVAEGRLPDREKSANIGHEVSDDEYNDAMSRHGTPDYTAADKMVVNNYRQQRSDAERAEDEERDGEAPGARGRDFDIEQADRDRRREEYAGRTADDLRDELAARGLPKSGSKQELVDRLAESDEQA